MSDPCKCKNDSAGCGYGYTCDACQIQQLTKERDDYKKGIKFLYDNCGCYPEAHDYVNKLLSKYKEI